MRFGCCVPRGRIVTAQRIGFDYVELKVTESLIPLKTDVKWGPVREEIARHNIPVEATNVFFPRDWPLIGERRDWAATTNYMEKAIERAHQLGVRVMVFGSGAARSVPKGFPLEQAQTQLREVLLLAGDVAGRYGIIIAIEPLRRAETNQINRVSEALALARSLQHPHVRVVADLWHMYEENEPLSDILETKDYLAHVHVADSGRRAPGTGSFDYDTFFAHLRTIGYTGRVSIECKWSDFEQESHCALAYLRDMAF